jgi:hypothetical protein
MSAAALLNQAASDSATQEAAAGDVDAHSLLAQLLAQNCSRCSVLTGRSQRQ